MSRTVREEDEEDLRESKPCDMHFTPSILVIPTYPEMQKDQSSKRDIFKARFYNLFGSHDRPATRAKSIFTQTSLDYLDNGSEHQLRAELSSKDKVILALKEKISQVEKLNGKLNRQLMKSSFAHSEKDEDIANLKLELMTLKNDLRIKDIFLVDHSMAKQREAEMIDKLAKQHMVILRLSQNLNACRKRIVELGRRISRYHHSDK